MSNDAQAYPTQHRNHEHAALLSGGSDGKEPGAVQEIQVPSLGWEDSLEKRMQSAPVFLPGESQAQRSLTSCSPRGHKESDTTERLTHTENHKT